MRVVDEMESDVDVGLWGQGSESARAKMTRREGRATRGRRRRRDDALDTFRLQIGTRVTSEIQSGGTKGEAQESTVKGKKKDYMRKNT